MTDRDHRVIERSYRESPASEPHFGWEVAFPCLFAAAVVGLGVYVAYGLVPGAIAGGAAGFGMLLYRLVVWDIRGRGTHIVEHEYYTEPETTRSEWAAVVRDNGDDGNGGARWRIGNWYWSQAEWERLARALADGRITRPALESVLLDNGQRMFPNASGRLAEYKRQFRRMGWADESDVLTPAARAWMQERGLPPPRDNVG